MLVITKRVEIGTRYPNSKLIIKIEHLFSSNGLFLPYNRPLIVMQWLPRRVSWWQNPRHSTYQQCNLVSQHPKVVLFHSISNLKIQNEWYSEYGICIVKANQSVRCKPNCHHNLTSTQLNHFVEIQKRTL